MIQPTADHNQLSSQEEDMKAVQINLKQDIGKLKAQLAENMNTQISSYNQQLDDTINRLKNQSTDLNEQARELSSQARELTNRANEMNNQIQSLQSKRESYALKLRTDYQQIQSNITNIDQVISNQTSLNGVNQQQVKVLQIMTSNKGLGADEQIAYEEDIPASNLAKEYQQHEQAMESSHREELAPLEMLNPILPSLVTINKKQNTWATKRLKTIRPRIYPRRYFVNFQGREYLRVGNNRTGDEAVEFLCCFYFGLCFCTANLLYECCGICYPIRNKKIEELNLHFLSYSKISDLPKFKNLKVLRLYYYDSHESLKVNLSNYKSLIELSISCQYITSEFQSKLVDELKALEKVKKLTIDLGSGEASSISNVIGFISTIESFQVNLKDGFQFSSIEYNLPKLRELSISNASISTLDQKIYFVLKM